MLILWGIGRRMCRGGAGLCRPLGSIPTEPSCKTSKLTMAYQRATRNSDFIALRLPPYYLKLLRNFPNSQGGLNQAVKVEILKLYNTIQNPC